jgi:tyrosine-protein kinase
VSAVSTRQPSGGSTLDEPRVDVARYLSALRRGRFLIAGIVIMITGTVLALSLLTPNTYNSTATIVLDVQTGVFGTEDPGATQRRLDTANALLLSSDVLAKAAEAVPGETEGSVGAGVTSAVDPNANLIRVTVSDRDPDQAAARANAIAQAFLTVNEEREQQSAEAAIQSVRRQIAALADVPGAAEQVAALRQRLAELEVEGSNAGVAFSVAEKAQVPSAPTSPRPLRNTVLAFFASIFLGVLVVLGRDQLRPRISESRELSQALGIPVLAGVPYVGRRRRLGRRDHLGVAAEHEAYQTLRAAVQLAAPPDQGQMILVTSAVHGEGKTTVTARLGRALAQAGHRTLVISADLRWPDLHEHFSLPAAPGLNDVLALVERAGVSRQLLPATAHSIQLRGSDAGQPKLDVLTSGRKTVDPARLLSSPATAEFFDYVRDFDYDYVLVDVPPLLGIADAQGLARQVDRVLFVSRLDRLTADNVVDVRDLMERLNMDPIGIVVLGVRVQVSPYYLSERPSLLRDEPEREDEDIEPRITSGRP